MKQLFVVASIAFGLLLATPVVTVQADSDSGSAWSDAESGSAMVLLLGGVAYLASRRRRDDAA